MASRGERERQRRTWANFPRLVALTVLVAVAFTVSCSASGSASNPQEARDADRADQICRDFDPGPGYSRPGGSSPTTAGEQTKALNAFRIDPGPIAAMSRHRFLAVCSYLATSDTAPTVTCSNGDSISTQQPKELLIDRSGHAVPYKVPDRAKC